MARKPRYTKKQLKAVAQTRIHRLFALADSAALHRDFGLADRYVTLARKLSMRYLVPMPREYKRRFCKNCYAYLLPGKTARVRIRDGKIVTYCVRCHHISRLPISLRDR